MTRRLADLVARRRQIVEMIVTEGQRADDTLVVALLMSGPARSLTAAAGHSELPRSRYDNPTGTRRVASAPPRPRFERNAPIGALVAI
ncbi:MAG: hypothetical protein JO007_03830 [Alphaproteobacteria bacterium]|nr:hypothetical protein [Alphaproteobacteria bacterium]